MFVKECDDEDFNIEGEPTSKVYDRYKEFCLYESLQALSKIEFSRQIVKNFELKIVDKKIGSKKYRVFEEDGR